MILSASFRPAGSTGTAEPRSIPPIRIRAPTSPVLRKRSVSLRGHPTSISVEDEFWTELKRMAAEAGTGLSPLIASVDARRGDRNLSSALRLAVLADLKEKARRDEPG